MARDKQKQKEYNKAYRETHKEETAAYRKAYYQEHAEKITARSNQYYHEHKDDRAQYRTTYKKQHAEEIAVYNKQYFADHAEEMAAYYKKRNQLPKGKYFTYKSNAKRRDIVWNLTFEQFCSYWQKPCHYCSTPIETIGLDRYNNNLGYWLSNVVPCCTRCNFDKCDQHGDDFIQERQADIDLIETNAAKTGRL